MKIKWIPIGYKLHTLSKNSDSLALNTSFVSKFFCWFLLFVSWFSFHVG